MRLRLHIFFRILKCSPGREAAAEAPSFTGATPANCRIQRPEVPPSKRSWSPLEVPFPNPHCPCIPHPQILSPRQVLSLSSGESVLESFNRLSHHWGNFLHSRFPRIIANSAADHGRQVGTAGARAVIGRLLRAGVKAVAAASAGESMAASCGVWGWLNPGTQDKAG